MFGEHSLGRQGALVAYGVSYYELGRLSAKFVQRILTGTSPQNLPAESLSKVGLAMNLKTARELGITIPQSLLLRADDDSVVKNCGRFVPSAPSLNRGTEWLLRRRPIGCSGSRTVKRSVAALRATPAVRASVTDVR